MDKPKIMTFQSTTELITITGFMTSTFMISVQAVSGWIYLSVALVTLAAAITKLLDWYSRGGWDKFKQKWKS